MLRELINGIYNEPTALPEPTTPEEKIDYVSHLYRLNKNEEAFQALKKAELNPNAKDILGIPLILRALRARHPEWVKFLIEQGADVNTPELLHRVVQQKQYDLLDFLLQQQGIKVNQKDKEDSPPIVYARDATTLQKLKEKGASIDLVMTIADAGKLTPVTFLSAKLNPDLNLVRLFLENGASPLKGNPSLLVMAVQGLNLPLVETILECGGNPFLKDDAGKIPAIVAALHGSPQMLELLLKHKTFNPDVSDNEGLNLALAAALSGHPSKIKLVQERGILLPSVPLVKPLNSWRWL